MPAAVSSRLVICERPALSASIALLESVGLPACDLTQGHLEHFFYCGAPEAPTALVGLELYGSDALLRSLVVAPSARDGGPESALLEHAEQNARSQGVRAMYLLTTTAEGLFAQHGYERIARAAGGPVIQATREFKDLCPQSSALMAKAL